MAWGPASRAWVRRSRATWYEWVARVPASRAWDGRSRCLEARPRATHSYKVNNLLIKKNLYYVTTLSASPVWKWVNCFKKIYLHFLLITKIILLKWLPSAKMSKSVSKVSDQQTFFGLLTVCIWASWCHSTWHHDNYIKNECHSMWCHDNEGKNQCQKISGTNEIIIALIILNSLGPIVKSGLHDTEV